MKGMELFSNDNRPLHSLGANRLHNPTLSRIINLCLRFYDSKKDSN